MRWSGNTTNSLFMSAIAICGAFTLGLGMNVFTLTQKECTITEYTSSLRIILIIGAILLTMALSYFTCHMSCGSSVYVEGQKPSPLKINTKGKMFFMFLILFVFALGVTLLVYTYKITNVNHNVCKNKKVMDRIEYIKILGYIMSLSSGFYMVYSIYSWGNNKLNIKKN